MRKWLLWPALWVLFFLPAAAEQSTDFRIDELPHEWGVILRVHNLSGFVMTVNLAATLEGASAAENPVVLVVKPGDSADAMKVHRGQGSWSYRYQYNWRFGDYRATGKHLYRLPYRQGETHEVIQGYNGDFSHFGDEAFALDFAMPEGTPILAARAGRVLALKSDSKVGGPDPSYRERGNFVTVMHEDGSMAQYYHLKFDGVAVRLGQVVREGDLLGYSGSTGFAESPHLHFMVNRPRTSGTTCESLPVRFKVAGSPESTTLLQGNAYRVPGARRK